MDKLTPYAYQEAAIAKMMAEPTKAVLLASEQDRGKTLQAVEFALRMGFERVLFIGIRDTFEQINERTLAQSDGQRSIRQIDTSKTGSEAQADLLWGKPGWYFIGQQLFTRRDWEGTGKSKKRLGTWDRLDLQLIVVDEVHQMAAYNSNGQRTLHNLHPEWKIAMSGTFYGNKFVNAWAPSYWLWPDRIDMSFWRWQHSHVQSEPVLTKGGRELLTPKGYELQKSKQPIPDSERITVAKGEIPPEGRFVASLPCYIRDVSPDKVPPPRVIEVELLSEQRRMYEALENDLLVWVRSRAFVVDMPVTLRERLRTATLGSFDFEDVWDKKKGEWKQEIFFPHDSHSTKLDALWTELAKYPTDNVVLGTHSKKFAKLATARMVERGLRVAEWSGDISAKERQSIKEQWLAGEIQYLVTVFRSFGTGLDWVQDKCWRMGVLSEQVGDPTIMGQWVKRVFRTGPHKDRFDWFTIQATGTYDTQEFANRELQQIAQQLTLTPPPADDRVA